MMDLETLDQRLAAVHAEEPVHMPPQLEEHLIRVESILAAYPAPASNHDQLLLLMVDAEPKWLTLTPPLTIIGRHGECDLCLDAGGISRQHCQFSFDGEDWRVQDLESKNGTRVNGKPIKERYLCHGDSIQIGQALLFFLPIG